MNLTEQLAELKRMEQAATPGVLEAKGYFITMTNGDVIGRCLFDRMYGTEADGVLLTTARNILPAMIEALEAANVVLPVLGWQGQNPDGDVLVCEICNGRGTGDAEPESVAHDDKCPVVTLRAALDRLSAVLEGGKNVG